MKNGKEDKFYLRRKGRWAKTKEFKYVIEQYNKYIRTVPPAKELNEILKLYGQKAKPSQEPPKTEAKDTEKYGQTLLNEPTEDEIAETLFELTK